MGLFDKEPQSVDEAQAEAMMDRLDGFAKTRVDQVDIPEEVRPTDLEAWILSPEGARARFAGSGMGGAGRPTAAGGGGSGDGGGLTPDVERMITEKFDRLEAALGMMEASLVMASSSGGGNQLHQVGEDGEVITVDPESSEGSDSDGFVGGSKGGAGLMDLYEAQAVKVNPFLKHEGVAVGADDGSVDAASLVAVLLDNLNGADAVAFIDNAATANLLNANEAGMLRAIAALAASGDPSPVGPVLPDRALLTFVAMVSAWRAANGAASQGA